MGRKKRRRGRKRRDVAALASEVLLRQAAQARVHVAGAIEGADPEELHDLRVAVRRMRAALRLFERALPAADAALDPARAGLKQTGAILGRARDLDVQIERLEGWLSLVRRAGGASGQRALGMLARDRQIARLAMRRHLRGPVFARRIEAVERAAHAARVAPARRSAIRLLRRPSKQVLLAVGKARDSEGDVAAYHALRIDVKRLRYALEFLDPALPFSTRKLVLTLRGAQDTLGALQDAAVEQAVADALIARAGADDRLRQVLERYRQSQAKAQEDQLATCRPILADLEAGVRGLRARL